MFCDGALVWSLYKEQDHLHIALDKILHVDFYQLFEDKEVSMDIPAI